MVARRASPDSILGAAKLFALRSGRVLPAAADSLALPVLDRLRRVRRARSLFRPRRGLRLRARLGAVRRAHALLRRDVRARARRPPRRGAVRVFARPVRDSQILAIRAHRLEGRALVQRARRRRDRSPGRARPLRRDAAADGGRGAARAADAAQALRAVTQPLRAIGGGGSGFSSSTSRSSGLDHSLGAIFGVGGTAGLRVTTGSIFADANFSTAALVTIGPVSLTDDAAAGCAPISK